MEKEEGVVTPPLEYIERVAKQEVEYVEELKDIARGKGVTIPTHVRTIEGIIAQLYSYILKKKKAIAVHTSKIMRFTREIKLIEDVIEIAKKRKNELIEFAKRLAKEYNIPPNSALIYLGIERTREEEKWHSNRPIDRIRRRLGIL